MRKDFLFLLHAEPKVLVNLFEVVIAIELLVFTSLLCLVLYHASRDIVHLAAESDHVLRFLFFLRKLAFAVRYD